MYNIDSPEVNQQQGSPALLGFGTKFHTHYPRRGRYWRYRALFYSPFEGLLYEEQIWQTTNAANASKHQYFFQKSILFQKMHAHFPQELRPDWVVLGVGSGPKAVTDLEGLGGHDPKPRAFDNPEGTQRLRKS